MNIKLIKVLGAIAASFALSGPAMAELRMPSNLRPLSQHLVKEIYADKTLDFGDFRYFYKKNGQLEGFSDAPLSFAEGKWTLDNNHLCVEVVWKGTKDAPPFPFSACYDWYADVSMTTYWTRISSSSDATLVGKVFQGNASLVRDGDAVTRLKSDAMAKLGY